MSEHPEKPPEHVLLAHGAGGRLTREMVSRLFVPAFDNPALSALADAAVLPELPPGRPALTTDGFVVDPPVFPGGDLGHLSVCGTVNDLAMVGARPLWLTWSLILEEGVDGELLETCLEGAARAARQAAVHVVAGDTKVVPRGKADRLFAVTAGLGVVPPGRDVGDHRIGPGDVLVASGPLADHGATVLACRHDLDPGPLRSDSTPLADLVEVLFDAGVDVKTLHDPTRGGLIALCHETCDRSRLRIEIDEDKVPLRPQVRAVCDLLGLDPLGLASEGRFVAVVDEEDADRTVELLRARHDGQGAAAIGRVTERVSGGPPVVMRTRVGGSRVLDLPSGFDLPRIC